MGKPYPSSDIDQLHLDVNTLNGTVSNLNTDVINLQNSKLDDIFSTASDSNNVYSIALSGVTSLSSIENKPIRVRFNAASTGNVQIKVNSLTAVDLVDYFGNHVTNVRQDLIANIVYCIPQSGNPNFQLLGKGGGGNAIASDLLYSKTATTDAGQITGTMPNNGSVGGTITSQGGSIYIPAGYTSGGVVTASLSGGGSVGGTITTQGGTVTIPAGYTSGGTVTAEFANLIASNVKNGVDIGGIIGNLTIESLGGKRTAQGTGTIDASSVATIANLDFRPSTVILVTTGTSRIYIVLYCPICAMYTSNWYGGTGEPIMTTSGAVITLNDNGFVHTVQTTAGGAITNTDFKYFAVE